MAGLVFRATTLFPGYEGGGTWLLSELREGLQVRDERPHKGALRLVQLGKLGESMPANSPAASKTACCVGRARVVSPDVLLARGALSTSMQSFAMKSG